MADADLLVRFLLDRQVQELVAVLVCLRNPGVVDAAVDYIATR
jgi:hypothetical protein